MPNKLSEVGQEIKKFKSERYSNLKQEMASLSRSDLNLTIFGDFGKNLSNSVSKPNFIITEQEVSLGTILPLPQNINV